jgi:hypothetical protein
VSRPPVSVERLDLTAQGQVQGYTLFFRHVAESLGWVFSSLIARGAALGLAAYLETQRRRRSASTRPA